MDKLDIFSILLYISKAHIFCNAVFCNIFKVKHLWVSILKKKRVHFIKISDHFVMILKKNDLIS